MSFLGILDFALGILEFPIMSSSGLTRGSLYGILDGILNGILDGILNEIAPSALLPRNDGIPAMMEF